MSSPFSSLSTDGLRDLVAGAGFREVRILIGIGTVRYPSAEEFLRQEGASSPLAWPVGALRDDSGIVFPAQTYLAVAHR